MADVVLEGVSREYSGGSRAVDNLSLTVQDRELLVLVGPSGCGKSTTLRMIAGLEPLSAGQIRIAGRTVHDVPPRDRDITMVFQNYALYPHMTVWANMAFALELRYGGGWLSRGWRRLTQPRLAAELAEKRRSISVRVQDAARILGIEHLLERLPRQLSGGERQRVALGRAIVRQPAAFLFDEPLSNLDARLRVEMRRELKQLHQRLGATMIYVTHDQVEALTLGDRIAVMNQGVLQQIGPPAEVYDFPQNTFVAGFLGTPAMNLLPGSLNFTNGSVEFQAFRQRLKLPGAWEQRLVRRPLEGEKVLLGVRPEDIVLAKGSDSGDVAGKNDGAGQDHGDWRGVVTVVEALGDATLVSVRLALPESEQPAVEFPLTVIGKLAPRVAVHLGDQVSVAFDPERLHLFAQSGESLLSARTAI